MQLAFSTNAYLNFTFAEAVRRLALMGYRGVEVMADVPHAWPAYLLPEQKAALRQALAANRLAISNVNAFMMHAIDDPRQKYWHPSWIEPDPHYRAARVAHTKRALSLAAELGAGCVTTEPGGPVAPGQSRSDALDLFIEELKPVADHAARVGVKLLIEPEPGLLIETADEYLEFRGLFDVDSVRLNFDIGHFYCVGDDPAATVRRLAPYIDHVHLEDIAGSRVHHHLIPGEGVIDFAGTLAALQEVGYDKWVTVELYPNHQAPDEAAKLARERVLAIAKATGVRLE